MASAASLAKSLDVRLEQFHKPLKFVGESKQAFLYILTYCPHVTAVKLGGLIQTSSYWNEIDIFWKAYG